MLAGEPPFTGPHRAGDRRQGDDREADAPGHPSAICVEPVGRDDLGQLVATERAEVIGGGQMQALSLAPAERVAGNGADHVLHEAILAAVGGARIGLDDDELHAGQPGERLGVPALRQAAYRGEAVPRERLARARTRPEQPPLARAEPVEPRGDERLQRLRDVERLDRARQPVPSPARVEQAAIEQHPHRLDRVQRDAFCRSTIARRAARPAARARAREQRLHRRAGAARGRAT